MSSQFVDMNSDGHNDILVGSFEGVPYILHGTKDGYEDPKRILDQNGETVLIGDFWNDDDDKWDKTDRAGTEGHCTSVAAVDWDADGDFDLILGDYYGGRVLLRLNEGSATEPKFAAKNKVIEAGGKPLVVAKGLSAPRVIDWDRDGKFDLLCGGSKGGVYYYRNTGTQEEPEFASAEVLIKPVEDKTNSFIKRVPQQNLQPLMPGSSYHIEAVDYDQDGDLDLLVGARSSWVARKVKPLTANEEKARDELQSEFEAVRKEFIKLFADAESADDRNAVIKSEEYQAVAKKMSEVQRQLGQYIRNPTKSGDFIWLFRRK